MRDVWVGIKKQLLAELPKSSFSLWINPITCVEENDETLILGCPNKFARNWIVDHYKQLIDEKLDRIGAGQIELLFKVKTGPRRSSLEQPPSDSRQLSLPIIPTNNRNGVTRLKNDFTFDRFVVGPSNEFAYSASMAMTHNNSWNYHSLLMLANTGLGKSHLSQAVGHAILQQDPKKRVYYVTAEEFTSQMVAAIKTKRIEEFKNKYRQCCDVLLLDEIHFLGGKEKTQLELGHTLDALANHNKTLLFTSSLPPRDIPHLSKELSSRFTSGLVTTIDSPNYETRLAILRRKASEMGLVLANDILHLLASGLKRDIRQMESALKCLKAKSELLKERIDPQMAKEVLKCFVGEDHQISLKEIAKLVCTYYKIEPETLRSKSRKKVHANPRNIYVYLCRRHTDETLENIGKSINRSHTTALYASESIGHKMKTDEKMGLQVKFLSKKLKSMKKE